jgi:ribokinase
VQVVVRSNRTTPTIAVVGSINTDLVVYAATLPRPGETALGGDLHRGPGGKGANQAVAAARLGAEVRMVGRVGDDDFGGAALANLRRHGVDVSNVAITPGVASGVALIVVDERGENLIALAPGANARVSAADVEAAWPSLAGSDVLLLQLEVPVEASARAARLAREAGMTVVLNPAPAPREPLPRELLEAVDVIVPNEAESEALATSPSGLRGLGPRAAIVTLGERGCVVLTGDGEEVIPAMRVRAADTTAAGDAFCGGLAHALARGEALGEASRFATKVAALAVTKRGAQDAMPSADEVAEL